MRLLHRRHGHGRSVAARRDPRSERARRAHRDRRQPLSLHRLPQHRRIRARRRPTAADTNAMIPAAFDYVRAESADDAVAQLADYGDDANLLADCLYLLPLMKILLPIPA